MRKQILYYTKKEKANRAKKAKKEEPKKRAENIMVDVDESFDRVIIGELEAKKKIEEDRCEILSGNISVREELIKEHRKEIQRLQKDLERLEKDQEKDSSMLQTTQERVKRLDAEIRKRRKIKVIFDSDGSYIVEPEMILPVPSDDEINAYFNQLISGGRVVDCTLRCISMLAKIASVFDLLPDYNLSIEFMDESLSKAWESLRK